LFGSNLRATVATTVPNFVRASVIPISGLFLFFKNIYGLTTGAVIVGSVVVGVALLFLWKLPETFSKDLDYEE
jgi:hypothetical protein